MPDRDHPALLATQVWADQLSATLAELRDQLSDDQMRLVGVALDQYGELIMTAVHAAILEDRRD